MMLTLSLHRLQMKFAISPNGENKRRVGRDGRGGVFLALLICAPGEVFVAVGCDVGVYGMVVRDVDDDIKYDDIRIVSRN